MISQPWRRRISSARPAQPFLEKPAGPSWALVIDTIMALAPSHRQCRPFFVAAHLLPCTSLEGDYSLCPRCTTRQPLQTVSLQVVPNAHTDLTQKRCRWRRRSLLMIACSQDNFLAESLDLQKYRYIWYCMNSDNRDRYLGRGDLQSMDTYTVFAMNSNGEVVGGSGHRVGRDELVQLIDKLLDSDRVDDDDTDDSKIIT